MLKRLFYIYLDRVSGNSFHSFAELHRHLVGKVALLALYGILSSGFGFPVHSPFHQLRCTLMLVSSWSSGHYRYQQLYS